MRYYLDTVTIRKLSKELSSIKKICYTSALCIFEIISGINKIEYTVRKKALVNLFASGIKIIWEMPEAMKTYAFPIIEIEESRTKGLRNLCSKLLNSSNFEEFISSTKDELYSLDFFYDLDSTYSAGFINATSTGNQTLKEIYKHIREKDGEVFEKIAKDYLKSFAIDPRNKEMSISAIANYLTNHVNRGGEEIEFSEVRQSYNGSIDVFIEAFSLFTIQKNTFLNCPSKNDFLDLHHLLYLGNDRKDYIVTDDKMILEITAQSISTEKFKQI